jgi:hypothetical protein
LWYQSETPSDLGDRDQLQEDHQAVNGQDINMQQEDASGDQSMEAVEDLDAEVEDLDNSGQTDASLDWELQPWLVCGWSTTFDDSYDIDIPRSRLDMFRFLNHGKSPAEPRTHTLVGELRNQTVKSVLHWSVV